MKKIIGAKPHLPAQAAGAAVRQLAVDAEFEGQRLDNFLLRELKGVPKTHVYRIIRSGEVRVNKARARADTRLAAGDLLRLPPVRVARQADEQALAAAPAREFPILFEDDALIAIDKPAGVAVHGGSGVSSGVIEQLRAARPAARFLELVHRLDRETSGVLLVAKKRSALTALQEQFRLRQTTKTYLALVQGQWPGRRKVLDASLARYLVPAGGGAGSAEGERRVRVVAADHPDAQRALTLVRVLGETPATADGGSATLLAVTIKTGRTHQIRVHLAHEGHAILGDDKYGDFDRNRALHKTGLRRMFLHAWQLAFRHPGDARLLRLEAALPPELSQQLTAPLLERLGPLPAKEADA